MTIFLNKPFPFLDTALLVPHGTLPYPDLIFQIVAAVAFTLFNYAAFYRYAVSGKAELASFRSYRDFFPRLEEGFDAGSIKVSLLFPVTVTILGDNQTVYILL